MVDRMEWFKRKFDLGHPLWMYPNFLERLRGTPARLEELIGSLATDVLTRRDGDKWSIQEHAGHLLDLEELSDGRLDDFEAGAETLRPADLENRKTHVAEHNSNEIANVLREFRAERMNLMQRLDAYDQEMISRTSLHPRLNQPMQVLDLVYFMSEHDDHHLASISALARKFES